MEQPAGKNCNSVGPIICKPSVTMGSYCITNEELLNLYQEHFQNNCPTADLNKVRHIVCNSMKIDRRYISFPIEQLLESISPQEQCDLYIKVGLEMAIPTIEKALLNADLSISDINAIVFTSQNPFPFPAFTNNVMNAMGFHEDCVQIPTNTLGCAGGSFVINSAANYLANRPNQNVLVLSLELSSLGFRPDRTGMMWFITYALFGDACAAFVVRGGKNRQTIQQSDASICDYPIKYKGLQFVHGKQRRVPDTTHAAYYEYPAEGYIFIMKKELTDIVKQNAPRFCTDLAKEAFDKTPKDVSISIIHPGGAKMIADIGVALSLGGTRSESLAYECFADGGNTASCSVLTMLQNIWDELVVGDDIILVAMGPGFFMDGSAMRTVDTSSLYDEIDYSCIR